jgi:uncharacterized membrane protein
MPWQRPYRFWRHVFTDEASARRTFSEADLDRLQRAIVAGEATHRGEVCIAIEPALPLWRVLRKLSPSERALEVFGVLRVWDTEENIGVLIYLLLADRDVEIVADRAIHQRVGQGAWEAICKEMESAFREGRFVEGVEEGIRQISALIAAHFPGDGRDVSELPDRPVVL